MHIVEEIPDSVLSLAKQELAYLQNLEKVDELGRQKERGLVNSQFIQSVTLEQHFKQFLDEVCRKQVRNG